MFFTAEDAEGAEEGNSHKTSQKAQTYCCYTLVAFRGSDPKPLCALCVLRAFAFDPSAAWLAWWLWSRPSPPGPLSHLTAGEGELRDGRTRHGRSGRE